MVLFCWFKFLSHTEGYCVTNLWADLDKRFKYKTAITGRNLDIQCRFDYRKIMRVNSANNKVTENFESEFIFVEPCPWNKVKCCEKNCFCFSSFVEFGFAFLNYKHFAKYSQTRISRGSVFWRRVVDWSIGQAQNVNNVSSILRFHFSQHFVTGLSSSIGRAKQTLLCQMHKLILLNFS